MDRGAWQVTDHRLAKSWTQLKQLSVYAWLNNHIIILNINLVIIIQI